MNGFDERTQDASEAAIMMVDDEPTTLDVLEMFLHDDGYSNVFRLSDSTRTLAVLAERRPDVLLLDLMMPEVGGLEILRAMRQDESLRRIPVIVLTSSSDAATKLAALELGATDFLSKPVDSSELVLRLRNTLAAKSYQDRLAYYDVLTGLPNRRLFIERVELALRHARQRSDECAVLHVDLDRFRQINDTLGHGIGDALLVAVTDRLEKSLASEAPVTTAPQERGISLARIGGNEFGVLLTAGSAATEASRRATRALAALSDPFSINEQDLFISSSIGIALFPGDGTDAQTLLANAGSAVSHAKQTGGNDLQFFDVSLNSASRERLSLENQLRRAVERDELRLYYQPKMNIRTGRIVGAEALMRWQHPTLGLVAPDRFIPVAEETGLIVSMGEWALRTACRQCEEWERAGLGLIRVAVNVSSRQFRLGQLVETVRSLAHGGGFDLRYLVLELTEGTIMVDPEETCAMLRAIKDMGALISVDDFGTGYSSLSYLKRFPLDELKIDRSFIQGVPHAADDAAIVTAIVGLAHSLGFRVVAEGVETEDQLSFLRELGCDEYQGFLRSRPIPPEDWPALLRSDPGRAV